MTRELQVNSPSLDGDAGACFSFAAVASAAGDASLGLDSAAIAGDFAAVVSVVAAAAVTVAVGVFSAEGGLGWKVR